MSDSISVSKELKSQVKNIAFDENRSIKDVTEEAIRNYIDEKYSTYNIKLENSNPTVLLSDAQRDFTYKYVAVLIDKERQLSRKFIDKEIKITKAYSNLFNTKYYSIIEIQYNSVDKKRMRDYYSFTKTQLVYLCNQDEFYKIKATVEQYVRKEIKHSELIKVVSNITNVSVDDIYKSDRNFSFKGEI